MAKIFLMHAFKNGVLAAFMASVLICIDLKAQYYLGISGDVGNSVDYTQHGSLFKTPAAPCGSITFIANEEIRNGWFLQYGAASGVMGYIISPAWADTLTDDHDFYEVYYNFNTFYINGHLSIGKQFLLRKKNAYVFLGWGGTFYGSPFATQPVTSASIVYGNSYTEVFKYEYESPTKGVKGFVNISFLMEPFKRIMVGLRYHTHFNPAVKGKYNFYHMKEATSGTYSVTQKGISFSFYYRIRK